MATPIWKDYSIDVSSSPTNFRVKLDGTIIHEGRAVPDGNGYNKVRMNDICRPYLFASMPALGSSGWNSQVSLERTFVLEWQDSNGQYTLNSSVTFTYDWSYQTWNNTNKSFPIVPVLDARQDLLYTTEAASFMIEMLAADGTQISYAYITAAAPGTHDLGVWDPGYVTSNTAKIRITGAGVNITYDIDRSGCHNYVLYYVNAFGGWDSFLITGKALKRDTYERKQYKRTYNNSQTNPGQFGTVTYRNDITRKWELHTDWLTDGQAQLMHHLLGSTMVYLQDLNSGTVMPVNITDSECVYKTFATNGHKMASYVINVDLAQNITRR